MAFGNVKVAYAPCKSVGQLKAAEKYMLGKNSEQIKQGVVKTQPDLYTALGCNRDNFTNNVLVTRKLHGKSYSKLKEKDILAHKMSISFHPSDNHKLNYRLAFEIANNFAEKFMHEKGHEVLFAVHTDTKHIHVHFLVSNCNMNTGKSYRRNQKDLYKMSEYLGEQCKEHDLLNSVREKYFKEKDKDNMRDNITFTEKKMMLRGRETWKEELREVVRKEVADPVNRTFDDVIRALWEKYKVETRVAGNTISYRHPEYKDKNNNLVSVRGSKLGEQFTVGGINYEFNKRLKTKSRKLENHDGKPEQTSGASPVNERGNPQRSGGQISSGTVDSDIRGNVQNIDSLYERYRKPVTGNQQKPDGNIEPTKNLSRKSPNRSR